MDNIKDLIQKCKKGECPFKEGYQCCASIPPLIFEDSLEKIMKKNKKIIMISEAPYNFPGYPKNALEYLTCSTEEFKEKHFLKYGLLRKQENYLENLNFQKLKDLHYSKAKENENIKFPKDIFSFIFLTFEPLFQNTPPKNWIENFFNKIYWTHFYKRNFNPPYCVNLLKKEIIVIQPYLIVSCLPKKPFEELFEKKIDEVLKEQERKINENDFLKLKIDEKEYDTVIFPNPSPANNRKKKEFYGKKDENGEYYASKMIRKIHLYLNDP